MLQIRRGCWKTQETDKNTNLSIRKLKEKILDERGGRGTESEEGGSGEREERGGGEVASALPAFKEDELS